MGLSSCDACERAIPTNSASCPYCGRVQKPPGETRREQRRMLLAILLSMAIFVLWLWLRGPPG